MSPSPPRSARSGTRAVAPSRAGRPTGRFTQHRRIDKLRELLTKHPRGLSLYELADALRVSPRTMRRYLKELEREFEFESEPLRGGGPLVWRIRSGEVPRKVALRRTQAYAILAARRVFEPLRGSALYEEIDLAISKLLDFAQRPGRGPNAGLADAQLERRFLYLPFAPKQYAERTEELDDLFQSVADLRPLTMLYRSAGRSQEERITVHPYALVMHKESIYCVGFHVDRGEIRTFLLDRMRDTECHYTERFDLPKDFSIDDYFQWELGVWRSDERHDVVIDFDAKAAEYARQRRVHPTQRLQNLPGGGVRLTMTVGNLTPVVSWALEWGPRIVVQEPTELVRRVTEELSAALRQYGARPSGRRKR